MFNALQIETLRNEYSMIERIDPCAASYERLTASLNSLDQETLKQLAAANIRFVSSLARNRVKN